MRKLSKKQKNIIKDYAKSGYFDSDLLINKYGNKNILISQLEKVNIYENMDSDLDRLIGDLLFTNTLDEKIRLIDNFS